MSTVSKSASFDYAAAIRANTPLETIVFKSGYSITQVVGILKANKWKVNPDFVNRAIQGLVKRKAHRKEVTGRDITVAEPRPEWQIAYGWNKIGGALTFITSSSDHSKLRMVITLTCHPIYEIETLLLDGVAVNFGTTFTTNGQAATSSNFGGKVYMQANLGDHTTALSQLIADEPTYWTSDHRQKRAAHVYLQLTWDATVFPNGVPKIEFVIKGKRFTTLYSGEPSNGAVTDNYWRNPAACVADFLNDRQFGGGIEEGAFLNSFWTAFDNCQEDVALATTGPEKRYICDGVWSSKESRKSILEDMLSGMAGTVVTACATGYGWDVLSGMYRAPTFSITEDDIIGPISVDSVPAKRESAGGVKATYKNTATWEQDQGPPFYVAASANSWVEDISLPVTTTKTTAQRLSKIFGMRHIVYRTQVSMTLRMAFLKLWPCDTVYLTLSKYGWTNKIFEVMSTQTVLMRDGNGVPYLGVNVKLKDTDSSVYAWTTGEEISNISPSTIVLPTPGGTAASLPTGVTITSGDGILIVNADGSINYRMKVEWTAPVDVFVDYVGVFYKRDGEPSSAYRVVQVANTFQIAYIDSVEVGVTYNIVLGVILTSGQLYGYTSNVNHTVLGRTAAPANVTGFSVSWDGSVARLTWNAVADVDINFYRLKITNSFQNYADSTHLADEHNLYHNVGLGTGSFYIFYVKAVNTSGIESGTAAIVSLNLIGTADAGEAMGVLGLTYS